MLATSGFSLKPAPEAVFRPVALVPLTGSAERDEDLVVSLAREEARARLELGRAGARFLAIKGWERLAFARVGDYARERLGISGRELQSFAFVATRLEGLPLLAAEFLRGEISWSQTRLLCVVADAESEASWLERARGLTVRELVVEIRRAEGHLAPDAADTLDDESDAIEGEPRVQFAIVCPARVTVLWHRALEFARRMLGSQAPAWQAAEAMVAEASSSVAIEVEDSELPAPDPHLSHLGRKGVVSDAGSASQTAGRTEGAGEGEPASTSDDPFALDDQLRDLTAILSQLDAELGAKLRRVVDLRLHRAAGFDTFDAYVREQLGISPAKARTLVKLERRARDSAAFGRAYRSGELSWVRALAILPVAEGAFDSAWAARASEVPVRRLQDEVDWALDMRDAAARPAAPPEEGNRLERPDLQTCALPGDGESEPADRRVTFFGPASVVALVRAGVRSFTERGEPPWKGFERLLLHAIAEWEAQPRHRDPIFFREGWRCGTPCCTSRRSLEDHHIEFRSRGGGNEQWNRVAVCAWHHHHAIHRYVVRASGRAPDDITWELGLRPGQAPLLRLHGERYLPAL